MTVLILLSRTSWCLHAIRHHFLARRGVSALKRAAASAWDGLASRVQRVAPSQRVFPVKIGSCNLMRTLEEKIGSRPVSRWMTGSPATGWGGGNNKLLPHRALRRRALNYVGELSTLIPLKLCNHDMSTRSFRIHGLPPQTPGELAVACDQRRRRRDSNYLTSSRPDSGSVYQPGCEATLKAGSMCVCVCGGGPRHASSCS